MRSSELVGISFPFRKENSRFPEVDIDVELIKSDLIALFETPIRNRVMRPTFGTDLYSIIFEGVDELLFVRIQRSIIQTITNWLPSVEVLNVDISSQDTMIIAQINYETKGVRDSLTMKINS